MLLDERSGQTVGMAAKRHRSGLAASVAALAVIGVAASCSHTPRVQSTTTTRPRPGTPTNPVQPSIYSVRAGRFVESVQLGDKVLEVNPAPQQPAPPVTAAQASSMFEAYDAFNGIYKFDMLGLGDATLNQTSPQTTSYMVPSAYVVPSGDAVLSTTTTVRKLPPTTTTHPTTTTTAPHVTTTTAPPPSTTTTTAPPPSTSPPSTSPSVPTTTTPLQTTTTAPTTTTTMPAPRLYDGTLAWVGIAVGQNPGCPGKTPATVAIVINAETGQDVVAVATGGCDTTPPVITVHPIELESVPWSPVGNASTAIVAQVPGCGTYVGWTELTVGGSTDTQVEAAVPYNPRCANPGPVQKIVNLVVPMGGGQSVPHAPLGPVDNLDVL